LLRRAERRLRPALGGMSLDRWQRLSSGRASIRSAIDGRDSHMARNRRSSVDAALSAVEAARAARSEIDHRAKIELEEAARRLAAYGPLAMRLALDRAKGRELGERAAIPHSGSSPAAPPRMPRPRSAYLGRMTGDSPENGLHPAAAVGFECNAADYEFARPDYPPDAVKLLVDGLGLTMGTTVVDVGAGTGKLTRLLEPTGARVVAVEPVAAMREQLRRAVLEVEVLDATAGAIPLADGSVDAIVCAQAFHWFATAEVLAEFARLLRPGGGLALVWNTRDQSVPWVRRFTEILEPWEGDRPDHYSGEWRAAFGPDVPFSPLETASFGFEQPMTPALLVSRAASMSFVGALDDQSRSEVLGRVLALGEEQGGSFVLPYRTDVHLTRRM
jgi:SAM-dependent methyltransferase